MSTPRTLKLLAPVLLLMMGAADAAGGPHYTPGGELIAPTDYREWVYLSSGIDMSYSDAPAMAGASE